MHGQSTRSRTGSSRPSVIEVSEFVTERLRLRRPYESHPASVSLARDYESKPMFGRLFRALREPKESSVWISKPSCSS